MSTGLYSGVSGLAIGVGLYKGVSGLWSGASGLVTGYGSGGAFDGASLYLNFATMSAATFDPRITFSRGTAATLTDSTGKVTFAPNNLLTRSQEFENAAWSKSGATAYAFEPNGATLGAELISNGDFSGGLTGWNSINATAAVVGGQLEVTQTGAGARTEQFFSATIGRIYFVTVQARVGTAASVSVTINEGSGSYAVLGTRAVTSGTLTTVSFYFTAISTTPLLQLSVTNTNGTTGYFDNASIKEVLSGTGIVAPDGTLTADKIVETATTGIHYAGQSISSLAPAGNSYVVSMYVKPGERNFATLGLTDISVGSQYCVAVFNLTTGAVTATGAQGTGYAISNATATPVGGGWYRCSVYCTAGTSVAFLNVVVGVNASGIITGTSTGGFESYAGNGNSGIYVWGAQLERVTYQTAPSAYYPTTTAAYYGPRFDYNPVTLAPKGLLIEEQRTNLLTYSEQLDNAVWIKGGVTVSANTTTSPDGTVDADKLVEDTANSGHGVTLSYTVVSATTYALSFYAKAAGRSRISFSGGGFAAQGFNAIYDVSNGTMVLNNGDKATITAVGNGWYRCTVAFTSSSTVAFGLAMADNSNNTTYTGDGTSGIFIWGAQLEVGTFATSYIPTVASQVTRSADIVAMTGTNFSGWYNQSEGTFMVEAVGLNAGSYAISVTDGTANEEINLRYSTSGTAAVARDGGIIQANFGSAVLNGKNAFAYKLNDFASSTNGGAATTDTSGTIPTVTQMRIGAAFDGGVNLNGHILQTVYFPTRLSNAQLQTLTSPPLVTTLALDFINGIYEA